jgi:2-polyprenyl-3-methyl-5-hydroxy-6-metoxy-1,4-benzoquinol methylase
MQRPLSARSTARRAGQTQPCDDLPTTSLHHGMAPGTEGYAEHAAERASRYEAVSFAEKHAVALQFLPSAPSAVLDVGAGSGADAAWFSAMGHRVVAVEPTDLLRRAGMKLHAEHSIEWIDDSLPELARLQAPAEKFDVVMLTAVWMHLDDLERQRAMPRLAALLAPGAVLVMSVRHGPAPRERRIFEVSDEETIALASSCSLKMMLAVRTASVQAANRMAGVTWSRLVFRQPR